MPLQVVHGRMQQRIGIYPGSFDPVTFGHIDVIKRASHLVDRLIIGVARHTTKDMLFNLTERQQFILQYLPELPANGCSIDVIPIDGLLVNFARQEGAKMIFRGLRAVADFEYEFQMAMMNDRLAPEIETVFLMASEHNQFIASKLVKEVSRLGGDVSSFVPQHVAVELTQRFGV